MDSTYAYNIDHRIHSHIVCTCDKLLSLCSLAVSIIGKLSSTVIDKSDLTIPSLTKYPSVECMYVYHNTTTVYITKKYIWILHIIYMYSNKSMN